MKNANPFITATQVTFVHDTEDLCAACGGDGRVVVDDPEFAIRAPCPVCGGSVPICVDCVRRLSVEPVMGAGNV